MDLLNEEITRIRYLLFEDQFKGQEKIIKNLLEKKLEKINAYLLFDRFFNGEADLVKFKETFMKSVKSGDLGSNLNEVTKNMVYLNKVPAVLGVLESIFKKGESNMTEALGYTFDEKKYEILYGSWCKKCANKTDVKEEVLKDVAKYQETAGSVGDQDELLKQMSFYLYGKDAGRMLPRLSLKYKEIKTLFGLVGRGGLDKRLDKRAEKLGISRYDLAKFHRNKDTGKGMENLPPYELKFNKSIDFGDDKTNIFFKINKGDTLIFNWDEKNKLFRHRTSSKKYTNATEIQIQMKEKPEIGESYTNLKIVKLIPSGGSTFEITPNIPVDFTIKSER